LRDLRGFETLRKFLVELAIDLIVALQLRELLFLKRDAGDQLGIFVRRDIGTSWVAFFI